MKALKTLNWKPLIGWLRLAVPAAIVSFLGYQLSRIGWLEIWEALPTNPAFYLLFLIAYSILPIADTILYRRSWTFPLGEGFRAFIVKRIYDQDVLDYSGGVSLLLWARRRVPLSDLQILRTIKDNTILSGLCGHVAALLLPLVCFVMGRTASNRPFGNVEAIGAVVGPILALGIVGGAYWWRRTVFSHSDRELAAAVGITFARIAAGNFLVLCQWMVVMPEQPLYVWFTLLALMNLVSRLPSALVSQLIFVSAGVEVSQQFGVSSAAAAGMLVVSGVLDKTLNAALFAACWFVGLTTRQAEACVKPTSPVQMNHEAA